MRIDPAVGPERDSGAAAPGFSEVLPLQTTNLLLFFDCFRQHADLDPLLQDEIVVIDVKDQPGSVLLRQRNALIIDETRVLH